MDIVSQLQSHPMFSSFTPEDLAEVVRAATATTYRPGDAVVRQGEAGEVFGILISGQLEAVQGGEIRQRVGTIEPGECFGEMSLLTGNPTSADVVAVSKSEAVVFLQAAVAPLIAMNPDAVRFLTRLMTQRLSPMAGREAPPRPAAVQLSLGAFEPMRVLSVSCRKHDMRYRYFDTSSEQALAGGNVDGLGSDRAVHSFWNETGVGSQPVQPATHEAALAAMLAVLTGDAGPIASEADLSVIGHRVCHGGQGYSGPVVVDGDTKADIRGLADLAPVENPYNLLGIEICEQLTPDVPQVAVFDTAFHLRMSPAAYTYALPHDLAHDPRLRRFGSHGISHEGAARDACSFLGVNFNVLKIIVCHLGSGASLSAIDRGRCIDNSMGLTPLAGMVMATRPGDLDPGLILHLIRDRGLSPDELTERLYAESGLLGLSGISADVLAVQAAADEGNPKALLAIEVFCRQAQKYLASYVGLLGGVDAIIFTGGIGENAPGLRARICQNLHLMDIQLDEARNRAASVEPGEVVQISQAMTSATVLVAGSNEEHTIARHAVRALAHRRVTKVIRVHNKPIPVSPSAHHVHLTQEHVEALFGPGHELTRYADLSQPGQFACNEQVTIRGPKGMIDRVRVLGPARPQTQVEIARTEEFKLGIDAPIRMSGDLGGSPGVTLEGPVGTISVGQGVICAMRHIHMSPQDAMEFAVRDRDIVRIRIEGERSLIFGDVTVRVNPDYALDMHIDTDEANAAELGPGAVGYLDSIQERATTA